jgi:hypothetical protein
LETVEETRQLLTRFGKVPLEIRWLGERMSGIAVNLKPVTIQDSEVSRGAVLVSNWEQGNGNEPQYAVFNDLFAAWRSQSFHVRDGYENERERIEMDRGTLAWALEALWGMTQDDEEEAKEYAEAMREVAEDLRHVRDDKKVTASKRTTAACSLHDSLDRFNPMSNCPRIWSSSDLLEERVEVADKIAQIIGRRRLLLLRLLDARRTLYRKTERRVNQLFVEHEKGRMTPARFADAADYFAGLAHDLRGVAVLPFGAVFARIAEWLDQAVMGLRVDGGPSDDVVAAFVNVLSWVRFLDVHCHVQETLTGVSRAYHGGVEFGEADTASLKGGLEALSIRLADNTIRDDALRDKALTMEAFVDTAQRTLSAPRSVDIEVIHHSLKQAAACI